MPVNVDGFSSEHSFKCLFDIYKKRVFSYAMALCHSPFIAEEITQEIFIKLWLCRETLDQVENLDAYIFRMVRNKTINYLRRAAHESAILHELQSRMLPESCPEDPASTADRRRQVHEAITRLPPQRRQVFQLSRDQGLNHRQIASQLHLSPNTVKNHLVIALKSIRNYLNALNTVIILLLSTIRP